jgi:hypothetical protein
VEHTRQAGQERQKVALAVVARKSWQAARREGSISRWSWDESKNHVNAGSYISCARMADLEDYASRTGDVGTGGRDGTGVESWASSTKGSVVTVLFPVRRSWLDIPKTPQQLLDYDRAQCHSVRAFQPIRVLLNPACGWSEAFAKLDVGRSFGKNRDLSCPTGTRYSLILHTT